MADDTKRAVGKHYAPTKGTIQRGNDYLLLIGIDNYEHFNKLNNAVKDIEDIGHLLTSAYGFKTEEPYYKMLKNEEATRENIIRALRGLCDNVKPEDRVLIYYSGHGYWDKKVDRGYWIPINAEQGDDFNFVSNSDIRDYIKAMNSRHTLLISDSCFSRSLMVRDAKEVSGSYKHWERDKSRWLFCSGKGVVSDGPVGVNSPFATALIRQLSDESVDLVNIARLADDVTKRVNFNFDQQAEATPIYGAGHDGGQFIFYRNGEIPEILPPSMNQSTAGRGAETPAAASPSSIKDFAKEQRLIVSKAKLKKAISNIQEWLPTRSEDTDDLENSLIMLSGRFNRLERDSRMGILSSSNENIERNRITAALLHLIEEIEDLA